MDLAFDDLSDDELEDSDDEEEVEKQEEPRTRAVESIPLVVGIGSLEGEFSCELSDEATSLRSPRASPPRKKSKKYQLNKSILHDSLPKKEKGLICLSIDVEMARSIATPLVLDGFEDMITTGAPSAFN